MKTLKLTLEKQWFDMELSGEKNEEYRVISDHWKSRFLDSHVYSYDELKDIPIWINQVPAIRGYHLSWKPYTHIQLFNGGHFSEKLPNFTVEFKGFDIGIGKTEWGAPEHEVFILKLGQIVDRKNC